jgi:hypothetical protein
VLSQESPISYALFSDTVLLYSSDDSQQAFEFMILAAQSLLGINLSYGLPLRGAITKGDVFVENDVFIGKAIVDAYLMEQQQDWAGCWVADDCVSDPVKAANPEFVSHALTQYKIPLKSGPVRLNWAVIWGVILHNQDLETGIRTRFFQRNPTNQAVSWDVERKFRNTLAFLRDVTAKR